LSKAMEKLIDQNERFLAELEKANRTIQMQANEIKRLNDLLQAMNRRMFGTSSEQTPANQLSLFEDETNSFNQAEITAPNKSDEYEEIKYKRKKQKGHKANLIKDLSEVEHVYELPVEDQVCDCCGEDLHPFAKREVRVEVEFIPAKLVKHKYLEQAYECRSCKTQADKAQIKTEKAPKPVIARSLASPSLLAQLAHQKFELSLPFYRQEKEWQRWGLSVSRRTLANWLIRGAQDWLKPIYQLLHKHLKDQEVIHADETVYQILRRSDGKPATSQSRIWLFTTAEYSDKPIVLYHSSLSRGYAVAKNFLDGFSGYLHCDGYQVYQNLPDVMVVACWAHLRRKFWEAATGVGQAATGVAFCNELFLAERALKELKPQERQTQRRKIVAPLVEKFWSWLDSLETMKGNLQKAVNYANNLREHLNRFLEDGRLVLSNNFAERMIRPTTVGRKNWNFSVSEEGGESNAIVYSIIQTAKANGLDTIAYLHYLFEQLPNLPFRENPELLEDYLPWGSKTKLALSVNK